MYKELFLLIHVYYYKYKKMYLDEIFLYSDKINLGFEIKNMVWIDIFENS